MKHLFLGFILLCCSLSRLQAQPADYSWNTQSQNSSESMPLGGGDIGLNVWVEQGDLLFYLSRTGAYDENNTLLKQGRFRVSTTPSIFDKEEDFRQTLHLNDGYMTVEGTHGKVTLWVDVFHPVVHVETQTGIPSVLQVTYENWRVADRPIRKVEGQQCSYKWALPQNIATTADSVRADDGSITFFHQNPQQTVFDVSVAQQGLQAVKDQLYNPLGNLIFGGRLSGSQLQFKECISGVYADTDYTAWVYESKRSRREHEFKITLHTNQGDLHVWQSGLAASEAQIKVKADRLATRRWWNQFWKRSFIEGGGIEGADVVRNYTLFRYMLGCNAYGKDPSKFNGGLFTFDPTYVDVKMPFTPDFRRWGGGTMTAQNQRLVYWPMLKNGDFDMMKSQFDFYNRLLPVAELRSKIYWNHDGACYTEQLENYGLPNPAEYGFKRPDSFDKGIEYNAWLEYQWDTVLEFCQMILDTKLYNGDDITEYMPMIESVVKFFDQHYRQLAAKRGRKDLDGDGNLIIYPGTACETYKMAHNPATTIAALRSVLQSSGVNNEMLNRIPAVPLRYVEGKEMIAPAKSWERVNNIETPQLYPVFPWRNYGVGRPELERAINTYNYDPDALKFRTHIGWKQDNIWAACLGLTDEAKELTLKKMGNGPHRFPAFWGPGYDWTPDLNWGGSGMIGMQEMLMQEVGDKIYLFPAWPADWDVRFKLHAAHHTTIEATLTNGRITDLKVTPKEREKDIVNGLGLENGFTDK